MSNSNEPHLVILEYKNWQNLIMPEYYWPFLDEVLKFYYQPRRLLSSYKIRPRIRIIRKVTAEITRKFRDKR